MRIARGDLKDAQVLALLATHLSLCRAETGEKSAHALDVSGLAAPEVDFFAGTDDGGLVAIGALKRLGEGRGEVKSMHTLAGRRGSGAGAEMLKHLVEHARGQAIDAAESGDRLLGIFSPGAAPLSPFRFSRLRAVRRLCARSEQPVSHPGSRRRRSGAGDAGRGRRGFAGDPGNLQRASSPPRPRSIATSRRHWKSARRGSPGAAPPAFPCSSPNAAARSWASPPMASFAAPFPAIASPSSTACMSQKAGAA